MVPAVPPGVNANRKGRVAAWGCPAAIYPAFLWTAAAGGTTCR
jgi:hypothetical protein